jgi:hypothetical protein
VARRYVPDVGDITWLTFDTQADADHGKNRAPKST